MKACPQKDWLPRGSGSELQGKHGEALPDQPPHLMMGLKRMSRVLMNMVGCTMYRALMFFLYLQRDTRNSAAGVVERLRARFFGCTF